MLFKEVARRWRRMGKRRRDCPDRQFPSVMVAFGVGLISAMLISPRFALFLAAIALIYFGITALRR